MDNTLRESSAVTESPLPAVETATGDASPDGAARLRDLKHQLHALGQHAQAAMERVSGYLHRLRPARGEPPPSGEIVQQIFDTLDSIARRQDSLEMLLQEAGDGNAATDQSACFASDVPLWAAELQAAVAQRLAEFEGKLENLVDRLGGGPAASMESVPLPQQTDENSDRMQELTVVPDRPHAPPTDKTGWLRVLLGDELHADPRLKNAWSRLQHQLLANESASQLLLGQLLVFRFAEADRKPALLKDVGEAFYRYSPKTRDTSDPLEDALAQWLVRQCETSGLPNSIELVHPGERFDATRHAPVERGGAEIVQVLGWVVLRDAGRVFSKALVFTR